MAFKLAISLVVGDILVLGPCEPTFTITRLEKGKGRLSNVMMCRAKPSFPTGEEGTDGCEQFEWSLDETVEVQ